MSCLPRSRSRRRPLPAIATSHRTGSDAVGLHPPDDASSLPAHPSSGTGSAATGGPTRYPPPAGKHSFRSHGCGKRDTGPSQAGPSQSRRRSPTPAQPTVNARPRRFRGTARRRRLPSPTGATPANPECVRLGAHAEYPANDHSACIKALLEPGGAAAAPVPSATDGPDRQYGGRTVRRPSDAVFNAGSCTRPRRRTSNCR